MVSGKIYDYLKAFDITDDLSIRSRKNFCLLHSAERLKMYQNENFDYKTYEINIDDGS